MNRAASFRSSLQVTVMRSWTALLSCGLLASCAAPYQAPQGKEVARLRVLSPQTEWSKGVKALIYPSGKCEDPMELGFFGGIARIGRQDPPLGIPGAADLDARTFIERAIPANTRALITLDLGITAGNIKCWVTFSFDPSPGNDYEATMSWDSRSCYVNLYRVSELEGGRVIRTPELTSRRERTCIKGGS